MAKKWTFPTKAGAEVMKGMKPPAKGGKPAPKAAPKKK